MAPHRHTIRDGRGNWKKKSRPTLDQTRGFAWVCYSFFSALFGDYTNAYSNDCFIVIIFVLNDAAEQHFMEPHLYDSICKQIICNIFSMVGERKKSEKCQINCYDLKCYALKFMIEYFYSIFVNHSHLETTFFSITNTNAHVPRISLHQYISFLNTHFSLRTYKNETELINTSKHDD